MPRVGARPPPDRRQLPAKYLTIHQPHNPNPFPQFVAHLTIMVSPSTWNTLGLGVAGSWAVLSVVATLAPHRTAELFGITALSDARTTSDASVLGFRGMVGSRDATLALVLYALARNARNRDLGTAILCTMTICVADLYIVLRRRAYAE